MKRAQFEYLKWINSLDFESFSDIEKHILNLITKNFKNVFNSGTSQGSRAKLIVSLIEAHSLPEDVSLLVPVLEATEKTNLPLSKISIGPFKGFNEQREFLFGEKYTLIYGPNGTGKSSLCEGLEVSILGYIAEAERKRIPLTTYIRNTIVGKGFTPKAYKKLLDESHEKISQSIEDYQYCFIEKNRIDDFSRISANTEKNQEAIILKLFGLDEFNRFVNDFTGNFANYLQVEVEHRSEFRNSISRIRQNLKQIRTHKENISQKIGNVRDILDTYEVKTPKEVELFLNGKNSDGHLAELKGRVVEVNFNLVTLHIDKKNIKQTEVALNSAIQELADLDAKIIKFASKVHYQSIYLALKNIEEMDEEIQNCPACETPLRQVFKNPFDNATEELEKLEALSNNQEARVLVIANIKAIVAEYLADFQSMNKQRNLIGLDSLTITNEHGINEIIQGEVDHLSITKLALDFDSLFKNYAKVRVLTKRNNRKRNDLIQNNIESNALIAAAESDLLIINTANAAIEQEYANIKELSTNIIEQQEYLEETKVNAKVELSKEKQNNDVISAYTKIVATLKQYRSQLPSHLTKNLNGKTTDYYNAINSHDPKHYLAKEIKLPNQPNDGLIIVFNDDLEKEEDALVVLSEGHIKCLGLAILLAKAEQENVPFIIFDDIVNAVDDEHRTAIRDILTQHPQITSRQLIISSHGQDFIRKLKEAIPSSKQQSKEVVSYTFLDNKDGREIFVSDKDTCQNYILIAEDCYASGNHKLCLDNLRKTLESLNKKIWKRLYNKHKSALTVKIWNPNRIEPDLRTLCDSLIKELNSIALKITDQDHVELSGHYSSLIPNWSYFNDGTHEKDLIEEFEKPIVKQMLDTIKNIEKIGFHGAL